MQDQDGTSARSAGSARIRLAYLLRWIRLDPLHGTGTRTPSPEKQEKKNQEQELL